MVAISIRIKLERSRSGKCSAKRDLGSTAAQIQPGRTVSRKIAVDRERFTRHRPDDDVLKRKNARTGD